MSYDGDTHGDRAQERIVRELDGNYTGKPRPTRLRVYVYGGGHNDSPIDGDQVWDAQEHRFKMLAPMVEQLLSDVHDAHSDVTLTPPTTHPPRSTQMDSLHLYVTDRAAEALADSGFDWFGTLDDLVRFVYGNQGRVFKEDAQVYRYGDDHLTVACETEYLIGYHRVYGTWEHAPLPRTFDSEDAWLEAQLARGELASAPDTMKCYACGGYDGTGNGPERAVVAHGPTVNPADPTASYVLACGHTII